MLKIRCKALNIKFYKNNFGGSRAVSLTQTDRQTDTTWLVIAFSPWALNGSDVNFKPFCLHPGRNPLIGNAEYEIA